MRPSDGVLLAACWDHVTLFDPTSGATRVVPLPSDGANNLELARETLYVTAGGGVHVLASTALLAPSLSVPVGAVQLAAPQGVLLAAAVVLAVVSHCA